MKVRDLKPGDTFKSYNGRERRIVKRLPDRKGALGTTLEFECVDNETGEPVPTLLASGNVNIEHLAR